MLNHDVGSSAQGIAIGLDMSYGELMMIDIKYSKWLIRAVSNVIKLKEIVH